MARSTAAEFAHRVDELYPLVLDCLSAREIRAWVAAKTSWGARISEAQLKRYIAEARRQIRQAASFDHDEEVGAAKRRLERVVARASAKGELSTVLGANKQLTELLGLAEPARGEVSVSVAEIDREIARLEDQIAARKARQQG